jgi:hypothetical protein
VPVTVATCFLSYEVIRRVRLLRPLFGLERGAAILRKLEPGRSVMARRLAPELAVPQDIN